jgi:primary-amine oxidase
MAHPHPLSALTIEESHVARGVVKAAYPDSVLVFRQIFLYEPPKDQVIAFLELEHAGQVTESSPRPARLAQVWFDAAAKAEEPKYSECIIDIQEKKILSTQSTGPGEFPSLIM